MSSAVAAGAKLLASSLNSELTKVIKEKQSKKQKTKKQKGPTFHPDPSSNHKKGPHASFDIANLANSVAHLGKTIQAPANVSTQIRRKEPVITTKGNVTTIHHTEYVEDLTSSSTAGNFRTYAYNINPANADLFNWLNEIARNFNQFQFESLEFSVVSLLSSGTNGMFCITGTGDPRDPAPVDKTTFLMSENAVRSNAWSNCTYKVPSSILHRINRYLISGLTTPSAIDADSTRFLGLLFVASSGLPANTDFGELYATYKVHLYEPQSRTLSNSSEITSPGGVVTGSAYPGNAVVTSAYSTCPIEYKNVFGATSGSNIRYDGAMQDPYVVWTVSGTSLTTTAVPGDILAGVFGPSAVTAGLQTQAGNFIIIDILINSGGTKAMITAYYQSLDASSTAPTKIPHPSGFAFAAVLQAATVTGNTFHMSASIKTGSLRAYEVHNLSGPTPLLPFQKSLMDQEAREKKALQTIDEVGSYVRL